MIFCETEETAYTWYIGDVLQDRPKEAKAGHTREILAHKFSCEFNFRINIFLVWDSGGSEDRQLDVVLEVKKISVFLFEIIDFC